MSSRPENDRPPLVVAMQWVSQITTVSLEMVLPAALGYWLDQLWGTEPWLLVVGAALGFVVAMAHLLQLTAVRKKHDSSNRDSNSSPEQ